MPDLVALDIPAGPAFVTALQRVWEAGDAAMPIDQRLAPGADRAVRDAVRPTAIVGPDLERRTLTGGAPAEPGDALVLATSGTTGEPRGVVLTHEALAASAAATTARLGIDPHRHRWLACLPLAHIGGLSVVTRALWSGAPLIVLEHFDAGAVGALARRGAVTHVSLVPAALGRVDPSLFSCILLGGAAPPDRLPPNVVTTYGMTETGSGVVYDGLPLDGVEVAMGTGDPGGGQQGEVLVRGPMLLRCYRDGADPRITGPDRRGGWLPTGDAGLLRPDGTVVIEGRFADVVVTGGEKVWPATVERVLASHPSVHEVAVWKRPDPRWGERVVAWVVPRDAAHPPSLAALAELASDQLAPWAAPRELELVSALPRTPSGKLRRRDLC